MTIRQAQSRGFTRGLQSVALVCMLSIASGLSTSCLAAEILLGTGSVGSFSHFTGRVVSRLINQHVDGLTCKAIPAPDSVHNLTNLQSGSLDVALVDISLVYDAINNKGAFAFLDIRYDNLTVVTPVYEQIILLVARADAGVDSLDQLKGKRINAGLPRSAIRGTLERMMTAKGWTYADFSSVNALPSSLSQNTMAFCHGTVQAMLHIGVHPDSSLQQLISLCDAVPIDMGGGDIAQLIGQHAAYSEARIPEATYPELDRPITTMGITVALMASDSLDDGSVGEIIAILDQHQRSIQNAHAALAAFAVGSAMPDVGVPLHPGAAAYLSQRP